MRTRNRTRILVVGALCIALVAVLSPGWATATDVESLLPSVQVGFPGLGGYSAKTVPTTFTATIEGSDADDPTGLPWKFRMLWIPAITPGGDPILLRSVYEQYVDELISWEDPLWSEWLEFPESGEVPAVTFPDLAGESAWLLALQVMDRNGAVSTGRGYQQEVANVRVSEIAFYPQVYLVEQYLGVAYNTQPSDQIAAGQELNFSWRADASSYNGTIVSYRHGWDIVDLDDPMDVGWEIQAGVTPQNLYAQERSFSAGLHFFYLRVIDDSGTTITYRWQLDVVPFVSLEYQRPLLLLDQVVDDNTNRWPSVTGQALDRETYRNEYWRFLEGAGGVANFDWENDRVDHRELLSYADVVEYQAVLCYARVHTNQFVLSNFRAVNNQDRYVWLHPYQARGGNLFLVGSSSLDSFIEVKDNYYVPTIFDSTEPPLNDYETSFGWKQLPDGTLVARGEQMYHYKTVGITALDWTSSNRKTIYGQFQKTAVDRKANCAGLKGLTMDAGFKTNHLIGPGVLADTLWTDESIDWVDQQDLASGTLTLNSSQFPFSEDEFVNANISPVNTLIEEQTCQDGPGGLCIEPMFEGISRYDWLREIRWAEGETEWPYSRYVSAELNNDLCGVLALTEYDGLPEGSALTNGKTFGYMSYKMVEDKPSGKADVYWGFDPYRFDHQESQKAVRWVLEYFGLEWN